MVLNARERPLSSDINQALSQDALTLREVLRALYLQHPLASASNDTGFLPPSGFLADGFAVSPGGGMTLTVRAGLGLVYDVTSVAASIDGVQKLDDQAPYWPAYLSANQAVAVPGGVPGGQERIDLLELRLDRRRQDTASRDVFNESTGVFEPTLVQKTLSYLLDGRFGTVASPAASVAGLSLKTGVLQAAGTYSDSGGTAGIPAGTAGYVPVAIIINDSSGTQAANRIRDERILLSPEGAVSLGFSVSQVPGNPSDAFTVLQAPQMPAGYTAGIYQLNTPSNGGPFRVFILGGNVTSFGGVTVTAHCPGTTLALANRLPLLTLPVAATISSAFRAALAGAGSTATPVAVGQSCFYFDVDARPIEPGDSVDATRYFHFHALLAHR